MSIDKDLMAYNTNVIVKRNPEGRLGINFAPLNCGAASQRLKVLDPVIVPELKCGDEVVQIEGQHLSDLTIDDIRSRLNDPGLDLVRFTIRRHESVQDVAVNKPPLIAWTDLVEFEVKCETDFNLSRQILITRKLSKSSPESYVIVKNTDVINIQYHPDERGLLRQILQRGDRLMKIGNEEFTCENAAQKLRNPPRSKDNGKYCIILSVKRPVKNPITHQSTERFDSITSFTSSLQSTQPLPVRPGNESPPNDVEPLTLSIDRQYGLRKNSGDSCLGLVGPGNPKLNQPQSEVLRSFQEVLETDPTVYGEYNTTFSRVRVCIHNTKQKYEPHLVVRIFEGPQPDNSTIRRTNNSEGTVLNLMLGEYHTHADITATIKNSPKFSLLDTICQDNQLCQVERKPLFQSMLIVPDQAEHINTELTPMQLTTAIRTVCSNMHLEIFDFSQVHGHMLTRWFAPILFNAYSIHIVFASSNEDAGPTLSLLQDIYFHSEGEAKIILCCNEQRPEWLSQFDQLRSKGVLVLSRYHQPFNSETGQDFIDIRDELYRQLTVMKTEVETKLHVLNAVFEVALRLRHLDEFFLAPSKIEKILGDLKIYGALNPKLLQIREYLHKTGVVFDPQLNKVTALFGEKPLLCNPHKWMKEVVMSIMSPHSKVLDLDKNETASFLQLLNITFTEGVNGYSPKLPIEAELKLRTPLSPCRLPHGVEKIYITVDRGSGAEPLSRTIVRDLLSVLSRNAISCRINYSNCSGQIHIKIAQLFVNTEEDRPGSVISVFYKRLNDARPFHVQRHITEILRQTALYKLYGDDVIIGPKCPLTDCSYQFKPHIIKLTRLSCSGVPLDEMLGEYISLDTLRISH